MKNIIKTDNYLLIVSDEEIKEGNCYYSPSGIWFYNHVNPNHSKNTYKIIAHLPLNNSRILEGVDLLPALEDEIEKLAKEFATKPLNPAKPISIIDLSLQHRFEAGYNKAKEKYKYTEEDIDKAWWAGMKFVGEDKGSYKEFIQSLQQPKYPIGFECEMDVIGITDDGHNAILEPKTTTNSQGQTVLVGNYIYE